MKAIAIKNIRELTLDFINGDIDRDTFQKECKALLNRVPSAHLITEIKLCVRAIDRINRARLMDEATKQRWSDELKEEKRRTHENFVIRERLATKLLLSRLNEQEEDE